MTVHDLLLLCLQYRPDQQAPSSASAVNVDWADVDWAGVVAMAVAQGVAPLLYHRLRTWRVAPLLPPPILPQFGEGTETLPPHDWLPPQAEEGWGGVTKNLFPKDLPPALWQTLEGVYLQNRLRNYQLYQQLATLLTAFHTEQIAVIVLKGAHLAAAVYENMALRTMTDLDLLVAPAALTPAIELLMRLGYRPLTPLAPLASYSTYTHHLPRFVKPGAPSIEVHWTITRANQGYTITMTPFWLRAQPCQFGGVTALALCPEDLLLHICLHATYQHLLEQGVRFLCDLDAIVQRFGATLDWQQVRQRAQDWGWARGVYLALYLAQERLGTPIPAAILQALQPAAGLPAVVKGGLPAAAQTRQIARDFVEMWQEPRLLPKAQRIGRRIFLPRPLLAAIYGVALDSPSLPWYYLVRIYDLLVRYGAVAWQLRQQAAQVAFRQKASLGEWLDGRA